MNHYVSVIFTLNFYHSVEIWWSSYSEVPVVEKLEVSILLQYVVDFKLILCFYNIVSISGLVTVKGGAFNIQSDAQISEILKYYWGVLLVIAILVVLALFIPLCGLCFCCCRCCGNCGARSQPCDKKRDLCKKIVQGTLLIVLGTALL